MKMKVNRNCNFQCNIGKVLNTTSNIFENLHIYIWNHCFPYSHTQYMVLKAVKVLILWKVKKITMLIWIMCPRAVINQTKWHFVRRLIVIVPFTSTSQREVPLCQRPDAPCWAASELYSTFRSKRCRWLLHETYLCDDVPV